VPPDQEPTPEQLDEVEQARMAAALLPFDNPKLRDTILGIKANLEQVIDQTTPDTLLRAGFDAAAKAKAQTLLANFEQFVRDHKDEIEAIQVLYSKPYRAGLRYRQIKDLATVLKRPPLNLPQPEEQLWTLYETLQPEQVRGKGGKSLVDLIALVRHALHPAEPIVPVSQEIEQQYQAWLAEQAGAGVTFTPEQRKWLDAIRDHIASSLSIEQDDFELAPFSQLGGLGKAWQLFGEQLSELLAELNARLAA
jgi:type I restriction enzyme R subunit